MLGIKNQRVALSLPVLAAVTSSAQHPWIQVIQNKLAGIIIFNKFIFFLFPNFDFSSKFNFDAKMLVLRICGWLKKLITHFSSRPSL